MKNTLIYLVVLFQIMACNQTNLQTATKAADPTPNPAPIVCTTECRIFVSQTASVGNFGGAAAADSICQSDARKPTTGDYKALLMDNTRNQTTNWVLKANTNYYWLDKTTLIGQTNSHRIFPISSPSTNSNSWSLDFEYVWNGIQVVDNTTWSLDQTCSNWTDASSSASGMVGDTVSTDSIAITSNLNRCDDVYIRFLCVEQ